MSVLPVIVRELRMQARQPSTHWLRTVGAVSVFAAVAFALWGMTMAKYRVWPGGGPIPVQNEIQTFGTTVFEKMNLFIFLGIWLLVPVATADAISRERREGTLPLLYLTELRSLGIVLGKTFVHGMRSASLFLAMAPWLMLPLVFGGVGLRDIATGLMLDSASLLLAQAAGLLASTIPRDWLKAAVLAELFALLLLLLMLRAHGTILAGAGAAGPTTGLTPGSPGFWNFYALWDILHGGSRAGFLSRTLQLLQITTDSSIHLDYFDGQWFGGFGSPNEQALWQQLSACLSPAGQTFWFRGVVGLLLAAVLVLMTTVWLATRRVERSWRDALVTSTDSELKKALIAPRFGVRAFKRRLSRALTSNPIGWLHHCSTSARMVKWGWCAFIILVEFVISSNASDLYAIQLWLGFVLLLGLTFSATSSFREELQTGAFELLLVTPLREWQIILGRVRGLWRQFLPAIAIYLAATVYLASGWKNVDYATPAWTACAQTLLAFCTLPFIGLYFSVQRWNFLVSWLAACVGGLLPAIMGTIFGWEGFQVFAIQLTLAWTAALLLVNRLQNRSFLQTRN
jgi:ABC-type transport system involved in multi-copper enzyme maturation permease subunit